MMLKVILARYFKRRDPIEDAVAAYMKATKTVPATPQEVPKMAMTLIATTGSTDKHAHDIGGGLNVSDAMKMITTGSAFNENGVTGLVPLCGPTFVWHAIHTERFGPADGEPGVAVEVQSIDEAKTA